jgi:sec-independent protein translocase protein TatC
VTDTAEEKKTATMTIGQHLAELRRRILICISAVILLGIGSFIEYNAILKVLTQPYCDLNLADGCKLTAVGTLSAFSIRIKIAYYCGMLFSAPIIVWQIWRFVTPGLKKKERKYTLWFFVAGCVFFALGVGMAFFTFGHALQFLNAIGGNSVETLYTADSYIGLIILMMVVFGLTFEFPVVLVGLQFARVVTPNQLLKFWRYALILITIASAVLTPSGDPLSMMAMMIPLLFFYFFAIAIGKLARR